MTILDDVLSFNRAFVERRAYEQFDTESKFPDKRIVLLTCMDTRLVELVTAAMNFKNGDIKIVRNAGALINHPFGSIMRSLLIAVYELQADEILIVGHYDCGMSRLSAESILAKMTARGIAQETIDTVQAAGIDLDLWLEGFHDVADSVRHSVQQVHGHPLMARSIPVHGLVIDPVTGRLDLVVDGYAG